LRSTYTLAAIRDARPLRVIGGVLPPSSDNITKGTPWTLHHLGSPAWAYTGMALFALICLSVNIWFYHRRSSPTYC